MAEMREPELVRGLQQGQTAAWRALHDAYAERVWRVVARLLGASSTDVADVVQETFLAAARSARNYDSTRGSLWSWLWGIARLQAALHFRKQAQADRLHRAASAIQKNGELRGRLAEAVASPSAALEQGELALLVRATLLELSPEHGRLLSAKYLEDATMEEIARQELATVTAVHSKLARARAAFRTAFGKYVELEPDTAAT